MVITSLALNILLVVSPAGTGDGATPAEQVLRAAATGKINEEVLENALARCVTATPRPPTCNTELPFVLIALASEAPTRGSVLEAIDSVSRKERSLDLLDLRRRIDTDPQSQPSPEPWFKTAAGKQGPPSRTDEGRLPQPVFKARVLNYLDGLLPAEKSNRTRVALEAATSESCTPIYGGRIQNLCEDLGLWRLQWASLWLAVLDLRTSHGEQQIVDQYLGAPRTLLEAAISKGELSSDQGLGAYMHVLRRWMERRPTRWQAWLDVEELLGPR